ncbi:MAG TPA: TolC family protein [Candidatus Binataceae bacterium]|nr:TolC family protein [Candidatus Binataceae bacterium]
MSRLKYAPLLLLAVAVVGLPLERAAAQYRSSSAYGTSGVQAPSISGLNAPTNVPQQEMALPAVNVPASSADQFESNPILSIPEVFAQQWSPAQHLAPESLISERYLRSADNFARKLTLKQAIYIAIRNNPALKATELVPIASTEGVREANAAFDPDLTSQLDIMKDVTPTSSALQAPGSEAYTQKYYDWDFGIAKVLATTNGTFGLTFDNSRASNNSPFTSIDPAYQPTLEASLSQPLLRNFGWDFASINVRLSESAQRTAQWTYGSNLISFVQRIGQDYWGLVGAEENLQVTEAALKFNADLVRVNRISLQVGTLAPIDLEEAQSAAATAEANVYSAEAALKSARSQLRQDVMLNPAGTFIPEGIEPAERPNPNVRIDENEENALELMVEYSPALGGLREAIRTALLQVRYSQNQVMPQLNIGGEFGVTALAGHSRCSNVSGFSLPGVSIPENCVVPGTTPTPPATVNGFRLPFGGIYGDALNHMLNAQFYNYAGVINFEMPLDNAYAKAALAQARIQYEEARMTYRAAISQSVTNIEAALANLHAYEKSAQATRAATYYAEESLHNEQIEFRVGLATTHDLLQFQSELVTAQGNEVTTDIGLENARLALWAAEGTLLREFNIDFEVQNPNESPWYARF